MSHVIEPATSSRAKCRGCGLPIAKDELRFGERQPNAFGDGEMTLWLHPRCAAFKRPEPFLEALEAEEGLGASAGLDGLKAIARQSLGHRRLPRVDVASRAPTGRARCRQCRETIDKDAWRIGLVFFEGYRFQPSGFIHAECAGEYLGTTDLIARVRQFSPDLSDSELGELERVIAAAQPDR